MHEQWASILRKAVVSDRTADALDNAMAEVERLRFEKSVMADELTSYAMLLALLIECLQAHGIEPPEGCREHITKPSSARPIVSSGEVFERLAPRPWPGGPEPGDRYRVANPWETCVGLDAVGAVKGKRHEVVSIDFLLDPALYRRVTDEVMHG